MIIKYEYEYPHTRIQLIVLEIRFDLSENKTAKSVVIIVKKSAWFHVEHHAMEPQFFIFRPQVVSIASVVLAAAAAPKAS